MTDRATAGWRCTLGGRLALTLRDALRRRLRERGRRARVDAAWARAHADVLATLRQRGIAVLPGYWSAEACARMRERIERTLEQRSEHVWRDAEGADARLFALERVDAQARGFHTDPFPWRMGEAYTGHSMRNAFTLARRLAFQPGNAGSGRGWHRDSFSRQFKALLYLDDVDERHGPFEYVVGSASLPARLRAQLRAGLAHDQNRLSDAELARVVAGGETLERVTGAAGTLVLFDPRGLHRGRPIEAGTRRALTNYYYPVDDVEPGLLAHLNANVPMIDGRPLEYAEIRASRPAAAAARVAGSRSRFILGMRVDATSYEAAADAVLARARCGDGGFVCVATVHMVMEAWDAPDFRAIVNDAWLVTPDGMPLVWGLRWLGLPDAARVYGPELTPRLCARAQAEGVPVGFYGGTPETLGRMTAKLHRRFPRLEIACAIAPPFRPATTAEDRKTLEQIRASGARVLFVGLGCPKQERWMAAHREALPEVVMLGVGAAFDFLAGAKRQAPAWVQSAGLEWLFRLATEPRRLWRRYARHNPRFVWHFARQLLGRKREG